MLKFRTGLPLSWLKAMHALSFLAYMHVVGTFDLYKKYRPVPKSISPYTPTYTWRSKSTGHQTPPCSSTNYPPFLYFYQYMPIPLTVGLTPTGLFSASSAAPSVGITPSYLPPNPTQPSLPTCTQYVRPNLSTSPTI